MPSSNLRPELTNTVSAESTTDDIPDSAMSAEHRSLDTAFPITDLARFIQGFDVAQIFQDFDVGSIGKVVALVVSALLLYDLLVYFLASTSSRKRLMMTPWLLQIMSGAWDTFGRRGSFARSAEDTVGPVLHSLASAAAKYGTQWEKSRLL